MKRLEKIKILELNTLIKNGTSLNKICSQFNLGKSTVYYHMKKIKGKKTIPVRINTKDKIALGEVIGIFAGDGYYANDQKRWDKRIKIFFNSKEQPVIEHYKNSFKTLVGKNPGIIASGSVKILQVCSKEFCEFILDYFTFNGRKVETVELKDKKLLNDKEFTKGFLKGLIDSDGYVRKGRKEIYFGSISKRLLEDFIQGLNLFKFKHKTYIQYRAGCKDFYKVRLTGEEVDRFVQVIKPVKAIF